MRILVTGSGAREHTLAWACAHSPLVERVYVAPGNGGTSLLATNVALAADDAQGLAQFAQSEAIDLVLLGPEASVVAGVGDRMRTVGLPCFGPNRAPGQIETSKAFAKQLMHEEGIPTADFRVFSGAEVDQAHAWARDLEGRVAVKADGLAQGKGVLVCGSLAEAEAAIDTVLVDGAFGQAGRQAVIEELLEGPELSLFGITDGREVVALAPARDYKRALNDDKGPNTGGLGAYSPPLGVDERLVEEGLNTVLRPAVRALAERGMAYRGVLYAGLMLTPGGLRVIEFNARFGDPEAQAVLPRLQGDVVPLLLAAAQGELGSKAMAWDPRPAVAVVLASDGYPGPYQTGIPIDSLDGAGSDVLIFHAATQRQGEQLVTAGGRVLTVVALGDSMAEARRTALAAAGRVAFPHAHWRTDIAKEAEEACLRSESST
jgi:phosphoribosylamine--glycine ligase